LQNKALERFATLNLKNISCKHGDGYLGWPLNAPFDAIIVTASPDQIPEALVDQLAIGGRMIIPLTQNNGEQQLILLQKTEQGMQQTNLEQVKFVPLVAGRLS